MFVLKPTPSKGPLQSVEVFGCKKTATVVVHCKWGKGSSRHTDVSWRWWSHTCYSTSYRSPFRFWARSNLLVWISRSWARVKKGGGFVAQIYVIPQSISKVLEAYCQKYVGEASKETKDILIQSVWLAPACRWPLSLWIQKVQRSWCPCSIPEILLISLSQERSGFTLVIKKKKKA